VIFGPLNQKEPYYPVAKDNYNPPPGLPEPVELHHLLFLIILFRFLIDFLLVTGGPLGPSVRLFLLFVDAENVRLNLRF
jgi:hypothetical protein